MPLSQQQHSFSGFFPGQGQPGYAGTRWKNHSGFYQTLDHILHFCHLHLAAATRAPHHSVVYWLDAVPANQPNIIKTLKGL